jgi:hypothetical protein
MFHDRRNFEGVDLSIAAKLAAFAIFTAGIAFFPGPAAAQQSGQKTFSSATDATTALVAALQANDHRALLDIFGPDAKDILFSGDDVEDKNQRAQFVQKYEQMHRLVVEPDKKTTLYIGAENWPTPIPLIHKGSAWYFDTDSGRQEILYRRVGRNEMSVIQVCRGLVDAQKEYFSQLHDGDSSNLYAQKIFSDSGKHNGLYWEAASGEPESPIGPLVAAAAAEGYTRTPDQKPQPFQGYYFRILTGQGKSAPGGTVSYVAEGKMAHGFAFVAYPAEYRVSGVMTFIVDQDGIVYEKDLGRRTDELAKALTKYERDRTWRKAE